LLCVTETDMWALRVGEEFEELLSADIGVAPLLGSRFMLPTGGILFFV